MVEGILDFLGLKKQEGDAVLRKERERLAKTWPIDRRWEPPECPEFQNILPVAQVDISSLPLGSAVMLQGPSSLHRYLIQVEKGNDGLRSYHLRMMNDERTGPGSAYEVKAENLGSVDKEKWSRRSGVIKQGETLAYPYFVFDKGGLVPWSKRSPGQSEWVGSCLGIKVFRPTKK